MLGTGWAYLLVSMLASAQRAKLPSDFKPIASLRLPYQTFVHMILLCGENVWMRCNLKRNMDFTKGTGWKNTW